MSIEPHKSPPTVPSPSVFPSQCPICDRAITKLRKTRMLNETLVCKKCCYKFANRRQLAFLIDWLGFFVLSALLLAAVEAFLPISLAGMGSDSVFLGLTGFDGPLGFLSFWVLPMFFYCKDGFSGMSLGKWLTGVQVVDKDTREPVSFRQSFKRNLPFQIPFFVIAGVLTMIKGRRWGDGWANTVVIWRKHAFKTPFDPRGLRCTGCGYNLTGNVSGRCPECGMPVPGTIKTGTDKPGETNTLAHAPDDGFTSHHGGG